MSEPAWLQYAMDLQLRLETESQGTLAQADGSACTTDSSCQSSSACDASAGCTGANLRTSCSPATGLDSVQCYGRCTNYCAVPAVTTETALYNRGAQPPLRRRRVRHTARAGRGVRVCGVVGLLVPLSRSASDHFIGTGRADHCGSKLKPANQEQRRRKKEFCHRTPSNMACTRIKAPL